MNYARRKLVMHALIIIAPLIFATSIAWSASGAPDTPQRGYTTTTLRDPIFDAARVSRETTSFTSWLNTNRGTLSEIQVERVREHLYYIIDSRIKQNFSSTGQVLPLKHDHVLESLFSWAERLGVYGGNLIFNNVKSPESQVREPMMELPNGITLELRDDLMQVHSDVGWDVSIPYYFMIGRLGDFKATNGLRTQLLVVSTGSAKDMGEVGHSQATLMLLYSPDADMSVFRPYWEQQFEIKGSDERVGLGIDGLTSQRNMDTAKLLHRELVFLQGNRGVVAVAYLGNDGTYQWNREHFLDFLRALRMEKGQSRGGLPQLPGND